jgi:branched-chain amino acid transport system permease protein
LSAFALYEGIANGIVTGGVYALVALSLVIIYKSTDTINFAGGEVVMAGGYVGMLALVYFELNYVLVFVAGAAGMFLLGALFDRIVLHRVLGRARPGKGVFVAAVIATVGLSFAIKGVVRLFPYTDEVRRLQPAFRGPPVELGPVLLTRQDIAIVVIALAAMIALFLFFQFTFVGKALRATSQNPRAAALIGIPVQTMRMVTWGVACALAAIAGILIGGKLPMSVDMGSNVVILAFAAAVIGGFTNLPGAVVGGILLGIVQNLVGIAISSEVITVAPFVVIMLVLIFRPQGLFGGRVAIKKV